MNEIKAAITQIFSGETRIYAFLLLAVFTIKFWSEHFSGSTQSLGKAYWAGKREKINALNTGMAQLQAKKHNEVTLYLGTPKYNILLKQVQKQASLKEKFKIKFYNFKTANIARFRTMCGQEATYLIPSANRGIGIPGSTGAGKSYTASDPLIRSAIDLNIPSFVWDLKCEQLQRHAAYALSKGYEVYIFAPGKPYSDCFNFSDYIRSSSDDVRSGEVAHIINVNAKMHYRDAKGDDYFGPAGDKLIELVLLMCKLDVIPHNDLLQAWAFLSLPDLAKRLSAMIEAEKLNFTQELSALNLSRVALSEKTVASILSTAINLFSSFCKTEFLPNLLTTTIPMKLDGKQIIFFQPDETAKSITVPLVAAVFSCLLKTNLNNQYKRKVPLYISIDEAASFYGDYDTWMNTYREYGAIFSIAYQNLDQFANTFGVHAANNIAAACLTNIIFNPNHEATAAKFSSFLGNREIKRKMRSSSSGKNSSHSSSEQYNLTPLITPDSINSFDQGEFILRNPAYKNGLKNDLKRAFIPWHVRQGNIPQRDINIQNKSKKLWNNKLEKYFTERAKKNRISWSEDDLRAAYNDRKVWADCCLPSVKELKQKSS